MGREREREREERREKRERTLPLTHLSFSPGRSWRVISHRRRMRSTDPIQSKHRSPCRGKDMSAELKRLFLRPNRVRSFSPSLWPPHLLTLSLAFASPLPPFPMDRRPYLATHCNSLREAEKWRLQVLCRFSFSPLLSVSFFFFGRLY
jgi:hypothetical protein